VHARHARIRDDQVDLVLLEQLQCHSAARGSDQPVAFVTQHSPHAAENILLVINQQHGGYRSLVSLGAHYSASFPVSATGWQTGSHTRKHVPCPTSLRTSIRPLCFCTML